MQKALSLFISNSSHILHAYPKTSLGIGAAVTAIPLTLFAKKIYQEQSTPENNYRSSGLHNFLILTSSSLLTGTIALYKKSKSLSFILTTFTISSLSLLFLNSQINSIGNDYKNQNEALSLISQLNSKFDALNLEIKQLKQLIVHSHNINQGSGNERLIQENENLQWVAPFLDPNNDADKVLKETLDNCSAQLENLHSNNNISQDSDSDNE